MSICFNKRTVSCIASFSICATAKHKIPKPELARGSASSLVRPTCTKRVNTSSCFGSFFVFIIHKLILPTELHQVSTDQKFYLTHAQMDKYSLSTHHPNYYQNITTPYSKKLPVFESSFKLYETRYQLMLY